MSDLPAVFGERNRYISYSNAPSTVTDFAGVKFRGLLASDREQDDKLVYVVVRMDTQKAIFAAPPGEHGCGSGSISAAPTGPLEVTWNVTQGRGSITRSAVIPNVFTAFPVGTTAVPVSGTDAVARAGVARLQTALEMTVGALGSKNTVQDTRLRALEARPVGMPWEQVRAQLWNSTFLQDKIYDLLHNLHDNGLINAIREVCGLPPKAPLSQTSATHPQAEHPDMEV